MGVQVHPSSAGQLVGEEAVFKQPSLGVLVEIRNLKPRD